MHDTLATEPEHIDTGTDTVKSYVAERVAVIAFNRPERRNALHAEMYPAFAALLDRFARDESVGCVVLTGEGQGFCAGGDVRDGRPRKPDGSRLTTPERAETIARESRTAWLVHEFPKITIAAVNGAAVGAGMSMALACDLRVMSRGATLISGWVNLALSGDFGGAWLLNRLVGPARALEILVGNVPVTADAALAMGLANHVFDDAEFATAWREYARRFAHGPPFAQAMIKANVADAGRTSLGEAILRESQRIAECSSTRDHREAVRAWMEKRPPVFGAKTGA